MDAVLELLRDNDSVAGRLATSLAIGGIAVALSMLVGRLAASRADDPYTRYHVRKAVGYAMFVVALIALAIVWRPFAGRIGVVLGFMAAGVAFAMQELIGAIAGWFNIISGRIFRVGDRIEMGGVQGDVIDITPLRTKILEMGSSDPERGSWVRGRQHTGRIVALSNKLTFTDPVYNYSSNFEFIWEELVVPVPYESDWKHAERVLLEEVQSISRAEGAEAALARVATRYPVPSTELEPRVFVHATDSWMELAARFIVPVRTARSVKDTLTRRVFDRLEEAGIPIASQTVDATVHVDVDGFGSAPQAGDDS